MTVPFVRDRDSKLAASSQPKKVEDREIEKILKKQEEIGLQLATDGEFRRAWWHFDFLKRLKGSNYTISSRAKSLG